jgi:probable F420-dependent oxidoreductase
MSEIRFGVFLPTFCGPEGRSGSEVTAFARRAEELGFDSIWATDHLLHGSLFYREPWLDPLIALSYAASVTSRVRLGTSILVMPTRHPLLLAKEVSTVQALADERFILGVGTGWDEREFRAVGMKKSERGRRTDESLEIVRRLLAGERLEFDGEFHHLEDIEVGPPMRTQLEVWVAGGRQLPHPTSPEPPTLARSVLARICSADGWIARPTAAPAQIKEDHDEILGHLQATGVDPDGFTVAHENFLHLVLTDDREVALGEQREAFNAVMSQGRPFEYFQEVYLTGTAEEIFHRIDERVAAGVQYFMFHTLEPSTRQLELWAEHLLPRIAEGVT